MKTNITAEFLQEYFRKHDTLTLYKGDGTPITFTKQYKPVMEGGCMKLDFRSFEELMKFYTKHALSLKPVVDVF